MRGVDPLSLGGSERTPLDFFKRSMSRSTHFKPAFDVNGTGMLLTLIVAFPCHKMCNLSDL